MIFAVREPQGEPWIEPPRARLYEGYLEQTVDYREDYVQHLLARVGDGPILEVNEGLGPTARLVQQATGALPLRVFRGMWGLRPAFASAPTCCCREWRLPFADDCFEVVYTEGQLRRWRDPCPFLRELLRVVRPGGCLLLHDLRRDADAYVTEYLVREMAAEAEESEDVRFLLRHFLLCLRASHSAGELEDLLLGLDGGGLAWQLDQTNEMSLTAIVEKRP